MSLKKRYEATLIEEVMDEVIYSLYEIEAERECENCNDTLAIATMLMSNGELQRMCRECCIGVLDEPEYLEVSNHSYRGN